MRCCAQIYKRDTYRYTGRGKGGMELTYSREQCSRQAKAGSERCWQHQHSMYIKLPWARP